MSKAAKPVLLVGGVPGNSAEEVFRTVAPELGDLVMGLTDGETGMRRMWIVWLAPTVFARHPDLEIMHRPVAVPGLPDWVPGDYADFWKFRVRDGVVRLQFDFSGYSREARDSYATFRKLRDEGVVAPHTRFQFCLPYPEDAVRWCSAGPRDMALMGAAAQEALIREVRQITRDIPVEDLVIQWDITWPTLAIDCGDELGPGSPMPWKPEGDPFARFLIMVRELNHQVPKDVPLGMHLCYGDFKHTHVFQPKDLGVAVRMMNAAVQESRRPVNFFHAPVPLSRSDDAYFQPLKDLTIGDTALYIGLVHYTDGLEGTLKRIEIFKRHYNGLAGVATECGLGRRPPSQDLRKLLRIHREAAAAL